MTELTLYRIRDELTLEILQHSISDEITAEIELMLAQAEHPHLDLSIEAYTTTDNQ